MKSFLEKVINYLKKPFVALPTGCLYGKAKWFDIVLRVIGYLDLLLLPLYSYLALEFIHYASMTRFTNFMTNRTPAVWFGIFIMYLLFVLIFIACRKGWVAGLIFSVIICAASVADYFKFALTGDYLYPWDVFSQTGNVGELASFLSTPFPSWGWVLILGFVIAVTVLIFTKPELPVKAYIRLPIVLLAVVLTVNSVNTPEKAQKVLNSNSLYLEDMALQYSNYIANGFTGAFVVNVLSTQVTPPENYGEELIDSILSRYCYTDEKEDFSKPDVILILAESFWDARALPGVEFSENPLANFDSITSRENCISGRFFTTGFGGGTVRPEFEVLTGLTTDRLPAGSVPWQYITSPTESYVSIYKSLGYKTVAMHPYTSSFYLRKEAYPLIGFDELRFEDTFYNHPEIPVEIDGKQITDKTLADHIKYYLDSAEEPVFLFGISMENHQPYTNKYANHTLTVSSDTIEAGVLSNVENYVQGLYHADRMLGTLADFVDNRERDTVLVWFGDHLPTLGANYGAYVQSGMIDLSNMTVEMKEDLQSTPYLIYSNFEFDEGMLAKGNTSDVSSYNLMNSLSTLIGAPRTPLMHFLEDYYKVFPYYNVRLFPPFPNEIWSFVDAHAALTYDRCVGKRYSLN